MNLRHVHEQIKLPDSNDTVQLYCSKVNMFVSILTFVMKDEFDHYLINGLLTKVSRETHTIFELQLWL